LIRRHEPPFGSLLRSLLPAAPHLLPAASLLPHPAATQRSYL